MELDSPIYPTFPSRSRRQGPDFQAPPSPILPSGTGTVHISTTSVVVSSTAVATYSAVNTLSLLVDPSASTGLNPKSIVTASPTSTLRDNPTGLSSAQQLFTPQGRLFVVGMVIVGLAVLTLVTCTIVFVRCTLRRRRRQRTFTMTRQHTRTQSQTPSSNRIHTEKKRKVSADRVSEFWSADANDAESSAEGTLARRPTRPSRTGEAESDLRAAGPGRARAAPSAMMLDRSVISAGEQDARRKAPSDQAGVAETYREVGVDVVKLDPLASNINVDPLGSNALVVNSPAVSKHLSSATRWTLDPDPFASSPTTSKPFLVHSNTFPPFGAHSPHTHDPDVRFTPHLSSSPPDMSAPSWNMDHSDATSLEDTLSSSNLNHFPFPPTNLRRSSVGMESMMSGSVIDPFLFERGRMSLTPSMANQFANIGVPPPLHIASTSPGIQTTLNPIGHSPSQSQGGLGVSPYTSYGGATFVGASSPVDQRKSYLSFSGSPPQPSLSASFSAYSPPQEPYIASSPPQQSHMSPPRTSYLSMSSSQSTPYLQTDISQALSNLRRQMSDSTVGSTDTGDTVEYRPTLGVVDESTYSPGLFAHRSSTTMSVAPGVTQDGALRPTYAT